MIDRTHRLSVTRQARLLGLSRAAVYYRAHAVSEETLTLMRRIDELHLESPFAGSRMLRDFLNADGVEVGREHVRTLMRRLAITAIYQRPKTTQRHPAHPVFPYLLRTLSITRPNHVWAADITYIPMARGFVYLVAIMDWATRKVLAWRVSPTLTADFCVAALEEALDRFGTPEIFNTDQGSQFTSAEFLNVLRRREIQGSSDQHGRSGLLAGQRLRRAALALGQVRRSLPPRIRDRLPGPGRPRATSSSLIIAGRTPRWRVEPRTACTLPHGLNCSTTHPAPFHLSRLPNLSQSGRPPLQSSESSRRECKR